MKSNKYVLFLLPSVIVLFIIVGIIIFPTQSIDAAKTGVSIWVNVLIPSLLPFIICANLVVKLKVVDILGAIINPVTRFIFNVSGKSALVFAISTVSGYPVGAKLASELRENNEISKYEGQRLISFCSTSGPLFIIGAIGIGMFNNPYIGYLLLVSHYLGSISVGLTFRNYGDKIRHDKSTSLKSKLNKIIDSRNDNKDGFFVLFGDSVFNGINTLLIVGGFVIAFSVVFEILSLSNVIDIFVKIFHVPFSLIGISDNLCHAFISGLFEITIGCNKVSSVINVAYILKVSLCSFLIAFSGLSILAQCCSFIAKTDLSCPLYIFSKFLHGFFSSIFTVILFSITDSSVFTSNFSTSLSNNLLSKYFSNFYISYPVFFILYILSLLIIIENYINKKKVN